MELYCGGFYRFSLLQGTRKDVLTNIKPVACHDEKYFIAVCKSDKAIAVVTSKYELYLKMIYSLNELRRNPGIPFRRIPIGDEELVLDVKCGADFVVILTKSGQCWFVGLNNGFLPDQNYGLPFFEPQLIKTLQNVRIKSIHTGLTTCFFLSKDGDLYGCGRNALYQLNKERDRQYCLDRPTLIGSKIKKIFKSYNGNVIAINTDDEIIPYGKMQSFELTPQLFKQFKVNNIKQIVSNYNTIAILQYDLDMYISILKYRKNKIADLNFFLVPISQKIQIQQIELETNNFYILKENGQFLQMKPKEINQLSVNKHITPKFNIKFKVHHFNLERNFAYFLKSHSPMEMDFLDFFESEILADMEIKGIKCHSKILNFRTNQKAEIIKENLESNYKKSEILMFLKMVYTGILYDRNKYQTICEKLSINTVPKPIEHDIERLYTGYKKDFAISVGNEKKIQVHKWFLAVRSNLFRIMFSEIDQNMTEMEDTTGKTFRELELLIQFLYTGKIKFLENDNIEQIIDNLSDAIYFYQLNENIGLSTILFNQRQKHKLLYTNKLDNVPNTSSGSSKKSAKRKRRKNKKKKKKKKKKNAN
ncbi:hypothetical protein M0813_26523 [Anaeramoeba flamelloides]|uniref:BTB domain-containing protein n=1 Tax=Anaeramoeba flamelloides TaxID=1746091 RepID=A0ABQ8XZC2_9EUKA|nr:hypothetical protein M0813_26523 [Anaeramoeba flamelloides]